MRIVALTGAGISAESGIPTFRGENGLWKKYRPEELATPEAFFKNPETVWEWYFWRRRIIAKAEPNPAHMALKKLEDNLGNDFWIITQNVDGLHQKAGCKNVVELHGNIWFDRCTSCSYIWEDREIEFKGVPKCPKCSSTARPDVVWFGEAVRNIDRAYELASNADIMLVIGTSAQVYPAALLPIVTKENGGKIIEINLERTQLSYVADEVHLGKAGEILPKIVEKILSERKRIL